MSMGHFDLDLVAQVPGGPGPFRLRVWISTQDPAASTAIEGVAVGLLTSLDGNAITVEEDVGSAKVIGGRTWHLFQGEIGQDLQLGAFLDFHFPASANTWLVQAPEFIPSALVNSGQGPGTTFRAARVRALNAHERAILVRHKRSPKLGIPATHKLMREGRRELLKK